MNIPYSAVAKIFSYNRSLFEIRIRQTNVQQNQTNVSRMYTLEFEMLLSQTPMNDGRAIDEEYYNWLLHKIINHQSILGNFTNRMLQATDGSYAFYRFRLGEMYDNIIAWSLSFSMYTRTQSFDTFQADVVEAMEILLKKLFQPHDAPDVPSVYPSNMPENLRKYYTFSLNPYYMYKLVKPLNITADSLRDMTILLQSNTRLPLTKDEEVPSLPKLKI